MDSTFEERTVDSDLTGEHYRTIVFPTLLLAEFRDGKLVCATPHADGGSVTTVPERLTAIESDAAEGFDPVEFAPGPGSTTTRLSHPDTDRDAEPRDPERRLNEPPLPR